MHLLTDLVKEEKLDGVAVTETWLLESDSSSFVNILGFKLFRCDVAGSNRKHGVCLYLKSSMTVIEETLDCPNSVCVKMLDLELRLLVVYRAPSYTESENDQQKHILVNLCGEQETLVLGDFNLPSLKWN